MKLLVALSITLPLGAQTLDECRGLRHHGKLAEAQACYGRLSTSSNPYLRAEGLWGIERYEDANNQFRDLIKQYMDSRIALAESCVEIRDDDGQVVAVLTVAEVLDHPIHPAFKNQCGDSPAPGHR